jgi:GWxTD domain-containing protein
MSQELEHARRPLRRPGPIPAGALIVALLALLGPDVSGGQAKLSPKDLAPRYQEWIKLTTYIIKDKERDVFLHLQTDRDRDLFIQAFWRMRDPTPGTPENEFQAEHIKRFQEANRRYRSAREGWMTDRGRFYIILGPAVSTESIAGDMDVYPAEIWSYYGDTSKGLPTHFQLVFCQYKNAGEFKLYDPVSDGPARLMVKGMTDFAPSDYQSMYQELIKKQPDLAILAFSIIPGESAPGMQPSLQTPIYMAAITESPKRGLDESYATHFLSFKGVVSTEYLTNYMKCDGQASIVHDPLTGVTFCDFAVVPERLSVDYYAPKEQYFCAFQIDVSLRAGDRTVFQYGKEFPLTIPEDKLKETEGMGFSIADSFPVIEGAYHLTVLLRNTAGKEFSVFEQDINVPPAEDRPRIVGPVLGVKLLEAQPGTRMPFQADLERLHTDPKNPYASSDPIVYQFAVTGLAAEAAAGGKVKALIQGATGGEAHRRAFTLALEDRGPRRAQSFTGSFPASDLPADYYEMSLTLEDAQGRVLDSGKANFIVSPARSLPHPVVAAKSFSVANRFLWDSMRARQYEQMGMRAQAASAYESAYRANPSYLPMVPDYAAFLLKERKPEEVLTLIEGIKDDADLRFQYFLLRGRALLALGRNDEAVQSLLLGNRIYNSDAGLLAALGTGYHRMGQGPEALAALRASLKLNPDQPEVEKLVREIEGKK